MGGSRTTSGPATRSSGWTPKLPPSPRTLKDTPFHDCHHPHERAALVVSLLSLALVLAGGVLLDNREVLVAVGALWVSMTVIAVQAATSNRLRGAEVTPTQFPDIYRLVEELRQRFGAPPVQVFVIRNPMPEGHAYGFRAPYVIVLHSALLDSLPADELRYALGQQLGHIQLGHTRAAILLGGDHSTLPAVLGWVAQLRDLLFAWYRRTQVTSADRAGVLACGSVGMAIRAQVKLSVGSAQLSNVEGADILQQASTLRQRPNRIGAFMVRLQSTTPPLIPRLEAMVEWAGMPEPNQPEGANGKA